MTLHALCKGGFSIVAGATVNVLIESAVPARKWLAKVKYKAGDKSCEQGSCDEESRNDGADGHHSGLGDCPTIVLLSSCVGKDKTIVARLQGLPLDPTVESLPITVDRS